MHRTLLLCFIHGFKGGDDTFGGFPRHLQATLSHALPNITVRCITYPKYETRGDLLECVSRFRDWLQDQVIDIEVTAGTPSPTIDPSVHVVLVGHSMGGIVAAETLLSIVSDEPIKSPSASATASAFEPPPSSTANTTSTSTSVPPPPAHASTAPGSATNEDGNADDLEGETLASRVSGTSSPTFMFPHIAGILAFDTPYLGISPGVLAYGAETHYRNASSAYNMVSSAANAFGWGKTSPGPGSSSFAAPATRSILPGPSSVAGGGSGHSAAAAALNATEDAAAAPAWQRWGKMAMFAGAAGAIVASGAAAYVNMGGADGVRAGASAVREGWSWAGSHLEFVGCLVKGEALKQRLGRVVQLNKSRGVGFVDMVTVLGKGAGRTEGISVAGGWVEVGGNKGAQEATGRTFCALPKRDEWREYFEPAVNNKVAGEIEAHSAMFFPRENPGYYDLAERARERVLEWVDKAWYVGSEPSAAKEEWMEPENAEDDPVMVD